jgi:hypothetical protein
MREDTNIVEAERDYVQSMPMEVAHHHAFESTVARRKAATERTNRAGPFH